MYDLQVFSNAEFGSVRAVTIDGMPYFVGKDVAVVLGYTNPQKAMRDHVDDDDKTVNESFTVNGTKGILINESGLYSLILSSKLPTAKKFKRWVTSEVLPTIRSTGGYSIIQQEDRVLTVRDVVIITSEVIKAMLPAVQLGGANVTVNNIYRGRRGKHSKVDRLPYELRLSVRNMMANESITFAAISDYLAKNGYFISESSIQRYASDMRKGRK